VQAGFHLYEGSFFIRGVGFITRRTIVLLPAVVLVILSLITFAAPDKSLYAGDKTEPASQTSYKIIGYSYLGTAIQSYEISPQHYNNTMLLTFAVHGFDDGWDKDGVALVKIGTDIIKEFSGHPEDLKETRLIVIPCVNPDGIKFGQSNNGFGRCNAQGIDINRDFDYYWQPCDESKYRTGKAPFSTPEAKILRDVVLKEKPDIIIDFHGWLTCTYGDAPIADGFNQAFGIQRKKQNLTDNAYMAQFFTGWASQYARTVLVEYPNPGTYQNMIDSEYSQKTINIIKNICSNI